MTRFPAVAVEGSVRSRQNFLAKRVTASSASSNSVATAARCLLFRFGRSSHSSQYRSIARLTAAHVRYSPTFSFLVGSFVQGQHAVTPAHHQAKVQRIVADSSFGAIHGLSLRRRQRSSCRRQQVMIPTRTKPIGCGRSSGRASERDIIARRSAKALLKRH
jgi:hypothetical protein